MKTQSQIKKQMQNAHSGGRVQRLLAAAKAGLGASAAALAVIALMAGAHAQDQATNTADLGAPKSAIQQFLPAAVR